MSLGENLLIGLATGTGVRLEALPSPEVSGDQSGFSLLRVNTAPLLFFRAHTDSSASSLTVLKSYVPKPRSSVLQKNLSQFSSSCKRRLVVEDSDVSVSATWR